MGLSRTVSEINCDFTRKSQIFPTPVYLAPPLSEWVPLGLGIGAWSQKLQATGSRKKFDDIFSCLDTIHERDSVTVLVGPPIFSSDVFY